MFRWRTNLCVILFIVFIIGVHKSFAGVVNPDISVIGQIISNRTDDASSENANTSTLNLGETEIVVDGYLNPYAKGFFVFAIEDGKIETEEAYLTIFKGLPDGFALKGGKYRVGFGKLNPVHPHAYSFISAPRVMAEMLPGEESFNETGVQASFLLPAFGNCASVISGDIINGSSFHPDETKESSGWVGRLSNSLLINDTTPLEIGASATQGTNNVKWGTKTLVCGVDCKTKIKFSPFTTLTLQGEYFYNKSDIVTDNDTGSFRNIVRDGFYAFADLNFWQRWNGGVIYDRYNPLHDKNLRDSAVKYFVGYSLLEETTLFRLAYEQFMPEGSDVVNTVTFQVVFSIGPHKAHQF